MNKPAFEDTLPIEQAKPAFEDTMPIEQAPAWKTNLSAVARPLIEAGGAVGGSLIGGGPETPLGIATGALGYGAGKSGADLLDRSLGLKAPLQNIPQALAEAASNAQSGVEMEAANLLINPVLKGAGKLALKGASAYFGPSEEAITSRLSNPSMAEASFPKTGEDLASHLNGLQKNLNDIEDKVWGSLLKLKAEPKSVLLGMVNNIKGQVKVTGTGEVASDADQAALDAMERLATRIKNMGTTSQAGANLILGPRGEGTEKFFDQNQLRQILQSVRKDVNWSDPSMTPKNESLVNFSHYLSEYLKNENPQYKDLIQQSADRSALLDNAERAFALDKVKGEYTPSNTTMSKLQSLLKPNNVQSQQVAEQVKNLTGMDLQNASQQAKYAGEFEKTATQGSRRAVMTGAVGAALGTLLGHSPEAAAIGAGAGGYMDKYAAQHLGGILDLMNRMGLSQGMQVNPLLSLGLLASVKGSK